MDLSIIIVNYKTPQLVTNCIESIYNAILGFSYEIIVVDNNSKDASESIVTSKFPQVVWINNDKNEGFGRANNIGINISKGKYILLLNSDIIVLENTINECMAEIQKNCQIGALSCRLLNEDGSIQKYVSTIASFRKILDSNLVFNYFIKSQKERKDAVMGAFMLMPRNVLNKCGYFDPDFFFFGEEIELCNRIKKGGFKIYSSDIAHAIHKGSGSNTDRRWAVEQYFLSAALLFLKVHGLAGYYLYHILFFTNTMTNFFAMWFLDKEYRSGYFLEQKYYFSNFKSYIFIPFKYSSKMGTGKRLLQKSD